MHASPQPQWSWVAEYPPDQMQIMQRATRTKALLCLAQRMAADPSKRVTGLAISLDGLSCDREIDLTSAVHDASRVAQTEMTWIFSQSRPRQS